VRTAFGPKWGFLRILEIGVAVSFGIKFALELPWLSSLYSTYGFAQARLADLYAIPAAPSLNFLSGRTILGADGRLIAAIVFIAIASVSSGLLLYGCARPWPAGACWLSQVALFNATQLTAYGADGILLTIAFYCFVMTLLWAKDANENNGLASICQTVLFVHLAIVYLASGVAKLKGVYWRDGSAFWFAMQQPQFHTPFTDLLKTLCRTVPFSPLASWFTLAFEISFPLLSLWLVTRKFALGLAIAFHFAIALFLGLWFFSAAMCVFVLAANYTVLPARMRDVLAGRNCDRVSSKT
jgi:hypothetical protein